MSIIRVLYESYSASQKPTTSTNWNTIFRKNIAYPDAKNIYYYRTYTNPANLLIGKPIAKQNILGIKTTTKNLTVYLRIQQQNQ